jgi:YHS domain-containing protein
MKHSLFLVFLIAVSTIAQAQTATRQKNYNLNKGVAINGYDPVSYFKNKPEKGSAAISYVYDGVTYRFANAAHLAEFKQNQAGFEPQYGGWCAYAMGNTGEKVEVDPETYKIIDGKLYLFYNHLFTNTLKTWNKNEASLKAKADANWPKINR